MPRNAFPWLLTGGAVAVIVYIGVLPARVREPLRRAA